ncbi:hypothetical protein GTZ99_01880 [Novosphingobium sp. FSY-8]|uniref:Mlr4354 like protein n=1 Tax=Novosphingobium ovatum TaxID=1908523 RepID=A0ABW9X9V4_9SPHN|nr:hypothetical protein [Novosphingobium ovatum]NBC35304.1 hypothetical protein [Novosphingobium ovatum]
MQRPALFLCVMVTMLVAAPGAIARDSLGMFGRWGAFRDAGVPRCYAIAMAHAGRGDARGDFQPYVDVAWWPKRGVRGQLHVRLSRRPGDGPITLTIGDQSFRLVGGGGEAWAADERMEAAILAAMRSASGLRISARGGNGRGFTDHYDLTGAPTAMDAAAMGCAGAR